VRGGLDDALDKLARRDELRRRAAGEATGTPPAVTELVEAIAAVVGRNPEMGVTVGVEGAGDPILLHFAVEDGIVQVSADNSVADRVAEAAPTSPRHADFDIDLDEPEHYTPPHGYAFAQPAQASESGQETRRIHADSFGGFDEPAAQRPAEPFAPHPFAATPPPEVPPPSTRRIHAEQHRAPEEPSAAQRAAEHQRAQQQAADPQRGMPAPLPEPIPLRVDTEETEMAAKRLAALLRDNPSLLRSQD
jgi:hypothetical protein